MKKYIFAITFFCILCNFGFTEITLSQGFNSVTSSDGVNVTAVGNAGKLYRSTNGGTTWAGYTNGTVNMNCVTSVSSNVWIAADHGTIYKTTDVNSPVNTYSVGNTKNLFSIVFVNSTTGFACGENGNVYRSTDGGLTWALRNSGIANIKLNSVSFYDANNGVVAGDGGNIYVTNNGGSSWTLQTPVTTKNLLKVKDFVDGYVAVGEYGALVVKNGSGTSLIASRTKTDIRGVTGSSMANVHICGGGGFIRNNGNGSDNFYNFEQNPMMANLVDIHYSGSNGWAVSSLNSVIIYTSNGGASWQMSQGSSVTRSWVSKLSASSGIGNNLCEHPFNRDALFVVYGNTVYRSGNRGDTWTNIGTITGGSQAHSFYVSPLDTNIWMVAITAGTDRVMRTTNYGSTWSTIVTRNFSNYGQPLEMDQNAPSIYYFAPDNGGFYKSTDNGASFNEISNNYPFRSPCDIIVTWDSSNVIFVGDGVTSSSQPADIFKSVNGGVNWTKVYSVSSSETPSLCNSVFSRSMFYATEWGGSGFYKSTNYGSNWSLAGTTGSSGWGSDVCHEDPTLVLKGTYGSPTYLTTNSGVSFTSTSIGGGAGAGIIVPDRGYLIAMQTSGLLKMTMTYRDSTINQVAVNSVLNEDFTTGFLPGGWSIEVTSGSGTYWIYSSQSGYDVGTGSAEYNFWNAPAGRNHSLVTQTFTPTVAGDSLNFDYAYAPYNTTSVDSLIIETSTNGGSSYTRLMRLYGKANYNDPDSTLNTTGVHGTEFNDPASNEWKTKKYALPVGTNKVKFRARSGFGNNLFLDNVKAGNQTSSSFATIVNLKLAPEGFYNGTSLNSGDTVRVYLRNSNSPFNKVDSAKAFINPDKLTAECAFNNAPSGTYYLQVIHRNCLETWSRYGGEFILNGSTFDYDFTSSPGQAYGSNMTKVSGKWCLFSGDLNHDGSIEAVDVSILDNDAFNFASGYIVSDLNGDGVADAADLAIIDDNATNFVSKITPENAPDLASMRSERQRQDNFQKKKTGINRLITK